MPVLRSTCEVKLGDVQFIGSLDFPPGMLPLQIHILQAMIGLLRDKRKGFTQQTAARRVSINVIDRWMHCNVYTKADRHVQGQIIKLYAEFEELKKTPYPRRTDKWKEKVQVFHDRVSASLFDIFTPDSRRLKRLELFYGVKMTVEEYQFLEDQRHDRKMFCEDQVDRQWLKTAARREREFLAFERQQEKAKEEVKRMEKVELTDEMVDEVFQTICNSTSHDPDYQMEDEEEDNGEINTETRSKRRRTVINSTPGESSPNTLPENYQHIRNSIQRVRPEYYQTVVALKSRYHCSDQQAVAGIILTGQNLFNLPWKFFDTDKESIDLDTAPCSSNNRRESRVQHIYTLAQIVDKIMLSGDKSTITYHDDGSRKQGTGAFSVQGISIDGVYHALPTLPIATESRANLKDLKLTTLHLLSAVSGVSVETLFSKLDFVMTDSTAHNMEVEKLVAEELNLDHIPEHLLCHTHPVLMMTRVMDGVFKEIEGTIGKDKIFASFNVTPNANQDSIFTQFLDCANRLISHDFDHKPWNKAAEFDIFIAPKKNISVRLASERFTRFCFLCAVTLHHDKDIVQFLRKFDHVTNNLACIVRCFEDIEFLRVFCIVGALLGIHLIEPFVKLTSSKHTTYDDLRIAFPRLYENLLENDVTEFFQFERPALDFISPSTFEKVKYADELVHSIEDALSYYRPQVEKVLRSINKKIASGWQKQRGDIFEFGEHSVSSLTISTMNQSKLKKAPVNNLDAERSVGSINYDLKIRGAKNLSTASTAHVIGKSAALTEGKVAEKKHRQIESQRILPAIVDAWKEKQEKLCQDGLSLKEAQNVSIDQRRNADLNKLKELGGPFTTSSEVRNFQASSITEVKKVERYYLEVRYARDGSLCFPKNSDIFRLKKAYKNLDSATYCSNLIIYFDKIMYRKNVDMADFEEALTKL